MRKVIVYDGSGITSKVNQSKPQIGDPCHTLHTDSRNYLIEILDEPECYAIENHPNDSRVTLSTDGIVQALTGRMGTGGGNTPIALIVNNREEVAGCFQNTGQGWWNEGDIAETIRTPCGGDSMKANLVAIVNS